MRWSLPVARLFGITIRAHATFPLLLIVVAVLPWRGREAGGLAAAGFVLLLFVFVVLHELGHSLVARSFRVRVREILLLPIGGVSRLENLPSRPRDEILIALAGPAVNVVLAGVFTGAFATLAIFSGSLAAVLEGRGGALLLDCVFVNVILAGFNLLPFFPMDGGRILRAGLSSVLGLGPATRVSASVGVGAGVTAMAAGAFLLGSFWIVLLGAFVALGALVEKRATIARLALKGVPVRSAMIREVRSVSPDGPMEEVVSSAARGFQQDFPVVADGRAIGLLSRGAIARARRAERAAGTVASAMEGEHVVCAASDSLEAVHALLLARRATAGVVLNDGRLEGLVTLEGIDRFISLSAGSGSEAARRSPAT